VPQLRVDLVLKLQQQERQSLFLSAALSDIIRDAAQPQTQHVHTHSITQARAVCPIKQESYSIMLPVHMLGVQCRALRAYLAAIYRLAAAPGGCRVTTLDHEIPDDAVKLQRQQAARCPFAEEHATHQT
jgi:hypothetical protein